MALCHESFNTGKLASKRIDRALTVPRKPHLQRLLAGVAVLVRSRSLSGWLFPAGMLTARQQRWQMGQTSLTPKEESATWILKLVLGSVTSRSKAASALAGWGSFTVRDSCRSTA
jgi:hypothetical protein